MKGKGVGGVPVIHRMRAANDDLADSPSETGKHIKPRPGWDPHEVWRVRVRESVDPEDERERERDPNR
jgi:hypothetical protein